MPEKKLESTQAENGHRYQANLEITGPKVASPGPQGKLGCLRCQFLLLYLTVSFLTSDVCLT
jgi:hypothetical protein